MLTLERIPIRHRIEGPLPCIGRKVRDSGGYGSRD